MEANTIQKYSNKTIPQLIKLAEKVVNANIRSKALKNGFFQCVSCLGWKMKDQLNAGHYYSAGHHPIVRFHPDNIHGQCVRCNLHLHGNVDKYRINLLKVIGKERLEHLDYLVNSAKANGFKWDRFSLIEIIEKYKQAN